MDGLFKSTVQAKPFQKHLADRIPYLPTVVELAPKTSDICDVTRSDLPQ